MSDSEGIETGKPTGTDVLQRMWEMQDAYEALTFKLLRSGQMGVRSPRIMEGLQQSLLTLTEAGTCQWGCAGGDHTVENLFRKYCNYGFGAIRLAFIGLYDEALALVRSMAEIGNLLQLFSLDQSQLHAWCQAETRQQRDCFTPYRVRLGIEALGARPIVGQTTYSHLCEMGIHASPETVDLAHGLDGRVYFGGNFSVPGFILVINQMGQLVSPVLRLVSCLLNVPAAKQQQIATIAGELDDAVSTTLSVDNYQSFFENFRAEQTKELVQQELEKLSVEEYQILIRDVAEKLCNAGEIPPDADATVPGEAQEKVFTGLYRELSRRAMDRVNRDDTNWLFSNASQALGESVIQRAKILQGNQTNPEDDGEAA